MGQRDNQLVPPPPPTAPSLAQLPPQGGNIFDAFDEQPAQGGNVFDAFDEPVKAEETKPVEKPKTKAAKPAAQPAVKPVYHPPKVPQHAAKPTKPAGPPNSFDLAGKAIGDAFSGFHMPDIPKAIDQTGAAINSAIAPAQNIPIIGDILRAGQKAVGDTGKTLGEAAYEASNRPLESLAGAAAGAGAGAIGLPQSVLNLVTRPYREDFNKTTGLNIGPIAEKEFFESLPGIKQILQGNPASAQVGELAAGMALPLKGLPAILEKPLIGGPLFGGAFGMLGPLEQQQQQGKPIDPGAAFKEGGLPGILMGGAFGAGLHALGKAKGKPGAEAGAEPSKPSDMTDHVTLDDGVSMKDIDALKALDDPHTPEPLKAQINAALDAKAQALAGGTPEPVLDVHAEIAKPEPENVQQNVMKPEPETQPPQAVPVEPVKIEPKNVTGNVQDIVQGGVSFSTNPPIPKKPPAPVVEKPVEPIDTTPQHVDEAAQVSTDQAQPLKNEPEIVQSTPEVTPATLPPSDEAPRWIARRSADAEKAKKGYHEIVDTTDNSVKSSSKRSFAQAQTLADALNAGEVKPTQGHQPVKPTHTGPRDEIFDNGEAMPEHVTPETRTKLGAMAEAKHAMDKAKVQFQAAHDAFQRMGALAQDQLTSLTKGNYQHRYIKEIEDLAANALKDRPDEVGLEVQNRIKYAPEEVKLPADKYEAAKKVVDFYNKFSSAKNKYQGLRDAVVPELKAGMEGGELPSSMNVPHVKGEINVRAVPKQRSPLEQEANAIRDRENVPRDDEVNRLIRGIKDFIKDERGSATVAIDPVNALLDKKLGTAGTEHPAVETIAEGAAKSKEISDLANAFEPIKRVFSLRRTLDIVHDHSPELHGKVWQGIAKETILGRGIKFEPHQDALVEKSLGMKPDEIRAGAKGLNELSAQQRNYLATRKIIRKEVAKHVTETIEKFDKYYGEDTMPNEAQRTRKVLDQLEGALTGRGSGADAGTFDAFNMLSKAIHEYIFKWNVPYHALNLLDPIVVGSARVGFSNIMRAKAILATDKTVRDFLGSHESKGPMAQALSEMRGDSVTPKGVKEGAFTKIAKGVTKFQDKLPDLPSEKWNFQDALAASIIKEGDRIKHPGGGTKYLRDMAAGKLTMEQQVEGYIHSLQDTMDITGAGALGLDKDPVQATRFGKFLTQFTSQPYRVARLVNKWLGEIKSGDMPTKGRATKALMTFAAMQTVFAGRAIINKEIEYTLEHASTQTRAFLYGMQDALDYVNEHTAGAVLGRDLTDKMKFDMVPFLGGASQHVAIDTLQGLFSQLDGLKLDKAGQTALFLGLSAVIGGGGVQMSREARQAEMVQKGEENVSVYPAGIMPGLLKSNRPIAKTTVPNYGLPQAVMNSVMPGRDKPAGAFAKEARRDKAGKTWAQAFGLEP